MVVEERRLQRRASRPRVLTRGLEGPLFHGGSQRARTTRCQPEVMQIKDISRRNLIARLCGVLVVGLMGATAWAGICWGCRKPAVDMPVSLAVGTVRTPEFAVKRQPYLVIIEAQKRLPFDELNCMLGLETEL